MGSFSNFWELEVLDHIFNKGAYTAPTIYVGLSTADPLDTGAGLAEPSGSAYARVTTSAGNWNVATGGLIDNAADLTFPQATGSWGTITHFALFDAATSGNMLGHGQLSVAKTINNGDTAKFVAGALDVTLD